jgi:hypothetical protein
MRIDVSVLYLLPPDRPTAGRPLSDPTLPGAHREADTDVDLRRTGLSNPANIPPTDFGVQEAAGAALGHRDAAKAQVSGPQR